MKVTFGILYLVNSAFAGLDLGMFLATYNTELLLASALCFAMAMICRKVYLEQV